MITWSMLRVCLLCFPIIMGCSGGGGSGDSPPAPASGNATINLNPTTFSFSVTQGDPNPVHTVEISNSGHDTLDWSVSSSAPWLTVSPSSGTSASNIPTAFTATANISGLTPGTYSGTITVIGDSATNTPQAVPATLTIAPVAASTTPPPTTSTSGPASVSPPTTSSTSPPSTVSVGIAWDSIGLSVSGYYVHYGTQSPRVAGSCAYSQSVYYSLTSLPNASAPTATISGLTAGGTYFFAVSAYDGTFEGPCSNEIWRSM